MSDGFVIVVEGCDKCGKSSLAAQLSETLGWPVLKFGQPGPGGAAKEYKDALLNNPGPFIADRFHLGENVYGPLYRKTWSMNKFECREIESKLLDRGALLVLMEDHPAGVIERFLALDETFARTDDVGVILREFDKEWRRSNLAKVRARWNIALPRDVSNIAMQMIAARTP